jgi:heavy metal efflux system protein
MRFFKGIYKNNRDNHLFTCFITSIKSTLFTFTFLFFSGVLTAQDDTLAIRLTLNQIIDSALTNHPEIKNAELNILSAKTYNNDILDIKPTEINYERGQLFSAYKDDKLEIRQNFGSPFSWKSKTSFAKNLVNLKKSEALLIKAQISNRIKAAFYECIYEMNRIKVMNDQKKLYNELSHIIDMHYKNCDTFILDKALAENQLALIISRADEAYNDYLLAKNKLVRESYISSDFEPVDEDLEMYEIVFSTDTLNPTQINLLKDYYSRHCSLATSSIKLVNSKFYPEITAGYFKQSIDGKKGFTGFQVGLVIPLWFVPQTAKRREAIIQKQIEDNNLKWQEFNIKNNSEKLKIELNKNFERLNYFYDFALKQADTLETIAIKHLKENLANTNGYLQSVNTAYEIRLEYLETLNNYNQAAIELELYTSY